MKEVRLNGLKDQLQASKRIVITNHVNPDGDAMGSALGLKIALESLGHTVSVVVPNAYPNFLKWMAGNDEVVHAEQNMERAMDMINGADMIFHLDYNAYARSAGLEETLRAAAATKVMIDHHRQPEEWPDYIFSDTDMSSTCQMVYEWLEMNDWLAHLNKDAAECLYTGLVTDTGSFRFASTSAKTLSIASHLMQLGVVPNVIYDRVFDTNAVSRLKLLGAMLDNMIYLADFNATILYLDAAQQAKVGYEKGDSEGFVNYGLSVGGVKFSVFFREEGSMIKVSLRSKGAFDVNQIARVHFNGGGHLNAAGGRLNCTMDEAIARAKEVIEAYKSELQS